jgi:hypothetical protein
LRSVIETDVIAPAKSATSPQAIVDAYERERSMAVAVVTCDGPFIAVQHEVLVDYEGAYIAANVSRLASIKAKAYPDG